MICGKSCALMQTWVLKQSAATLAKKRAPNIKMFLQIAIDFAGCHHENWDESGCPNALKGGEIPLPARLMALADMFDTLISRRGCEPAFSWDKTCAFLIQDKGKHFDPELLEIFITRKQEFLTIANRYKDLQA